MKPRRIAPATSAGATDARRRVNDAPVAPGWTRNAREGRPALAARYRQGAFSLIELIMAMVLMGILAGIVAVFFKPAFDGYLASKRRADLSDLADTVLRRMMQEVRSAVPNSIQVVDATTVSDGVACFQFVPTVGGGRYRLDFDPVNDVAPPCAPSATCSAFPDPAASAASATTFDVLLAQGNAPRLADYVVINNQATTDVYGASPASRYTVTGTPTTPRATDGTLRVVINGNPAASGYVGGRFQVVDPAVPSVMFSCTGGRLSRKVLGTSLAAACDASGDLLATDVATCEFNYSSSPSATAASGFLGLYLKLQREDEPVDLSYGIHVDNQP